ncbi:hypothetical protein ACOME3_003244 [Neoechinorhynchus agilis]
MSELQITSRFNCWIDFRLQMNRQQLSDNVREVYNIVSGDMMRPVQRDKILKDLKYRVLDLSRCIQRSTSRNTKLKQRLSNRHWKRALSKCKTVHIEYEKYQNLHHLWSEYIADVVKDQKDPTLELAMADYHGARITEAEKTNVRGIIIGETKNTFVVIDDKSRRRIVPKYGFFKFETKSGFAFYVFGQNIRLRPEARNGKARRPQPVRMPNKQDK